MEGLVPAVTSAILSVMPLWTSDAEQSRATSYAAIIVEEAQAVQPEIDPFLMVAIIYRESSFRPNISGKRGEVGLMQIFPYGALMRTINKGVTREDLKDVRTNVRVGVSHLLFWQNECGADDMAVWLSAYNSGKCKRNGYGSRVMHLYCELKPGGCEDIS
jgi:soluble lytic murein transglycosylase-like protein